MQVDFGHDLEQHLDFLVDCRATFSNMDSLRVGLHLTWQLLGHSSHDELFRSRSKGIQSTSLLSKIKYSFPNTSLIS